ncbi:MAG TPA: zinc ABC transporter ATP-binding protein [Prolixibacteraceae bacterium]|nr:zinc ABC transporter ATP-binding protein [Prolixibacteraceae bacterium]
MKPLIHLNHITFSYSGTPVLEDVDLKIHENDFIGVIGPNGGGKTTLLKLILGLIKPDSGKIYFREDLPRHKRPIGYLPQVKHLDRKFPITVLDVVRSGSMMRPFPFQNKNDEKEAAMNLLDEAGISHISTKAIGELSGGQMQRAFLCRALISDPKVLILDEPDTFVDAHFEGELYDRLRILNEKMAIVLVSHDVGTISMYVKTIACVNRTLHYHPSNQITMEDLAVYNCPLQIITHGEIPHTVLKKHHDHE